jgi:hypothetical protein
MVSCIAVAVVASWVASARADVILGQHDWSGALPAGEAEWASGWTTRDNGANQNWLKITFPTVVNPESDQDHWNDTVNVQAENLFAGGGAPGVRVNFNFFAEPEFWTLGSEGEYLDDLSTIDWLGVYIDRTGAGAQDYGLDDVTLSIPEPPEVIMLGSALLLSLSSLRRRRKTT